MECLLEGAVEDLNVEQSAKDEREEPLC
jgi:hypothetical protein